jgi:hypothetical protein
VANLIDGTELELESGALVMFYSACLGSEAKGAKRPRSETPNVLSLTYGKWRSKGSNGGGSNSLIN